MLTPCSRRGDSRGYAAAPSDTRRPVTATRTRAIDDWPPLRGRDVRAPCALGPVVPGLTPARARSRSTSGTRVGPPTLDDSPRPSAPGRIWVNANDYDQIASLDVGEGQVLLIPVDPGTYRVGAESGDARCHEHKARRRRPVRSRSCTSSARSSEERGWGTARMATTPRLACCLSRREVSYDRRLGSSRL